MSCCYVRRIYIYGNFNYSCCYPKYSIAVWVPFSMAFWHNIIKHSTSPGGMRNVCMYPNFLFGFATELYSRTSIVINFCRKYFPTFRVPIQVEGRGGRLAGPLKGACNFMQIVWRKTTYPNSANEIARRCQAKDLWRFFNYRSLKTTFISKGLIIMKTSKWKGTQKDEKNREIFVKN